MKNITILAFFIALLSWANIGFGQVKFNLKYLPEQDLYQVYFLSEVLWEAPYNKIASAQVSIKVPTGEFEVTEVTSLVNGLRFEANSRYNSPDEDPDYDYISFGLQNLGTDAMLFEKEKMLPVFSFRNARGCNGLVSLVDNKQNLFMPPNSRNANIANHIVVFGAKGEAYSGNLENEPVGCSLSTSTEIIDKEKSILTLYPNPASEVVNLNLFWKAKRDATIVTLRDADGRIIQEFNLELVNGINTLKIPISDYAGGIYSVEVQGKDTALFDRFIKIK